MLFEHSVLVGMELCQLRKERHQSVFGLGDYHTNYNRFSDSLFLSSFLSLSQRKDGSGNLKREIAINFGIKRERGSIPQTC
jgi:hypothetical protein